MYGKIKFNIMHNAIMNYIVNSICQFRYVRKLYVIRLKLKVRMYFNITRFFHV